ncbi:M23 family metallopeptidase [Mesorhizobium sp. 10J20-29]
MSFDPTNTQRYSSRAAGVCGVLFKSLTRLCPVLLAVLLLSSGLRAEERVEAAGRERSQAFLAGEFETIWRDMTAEMQGALGNVEALAELRERLAAGWGSEAEVVAEETSRKGGYGIYLRTSRWSATDQPVEMQWAFDDAMAIAGFFVRQKPRAAQSRHLDYATKASLRLPFDGEWHVYWGGRTLEENYHAVDAAQRFAVDLLIRRDGASHAGDPHRLESYFCWDAPVLAPAGGEVVEAVTGLPDQAIGETDAEHPAGNHVVLDLGAGAYLFLAHLRQGSVQVSTGDSVKAGQEIGRCGNSGNTSEPHLHVHMQTTPDLAEGEGLPMQFETFLADGRLVATGELRKGQQVAPAGKGID